MILHEDDMGAYPKILAVVFGDDNVKHAGPGDHPSGSGQDTHGNRYGSDGDSGDVGGTEAAKEERDLWFTDDPEYVATLTDEEIDELEMLLDSTADPGDPGTVTIAGVTMQRSDAENSDIAQHLAVVDGDKRGLSLSGNPLDAGDPIGLFGEYGNFEPDEEPDMDTFIRNQRPVTDFIAPSTGFVMHDGMSLDLGGGRYRAEDHRIVIPTEAARERWGWGDIGRTEALMETMRKSRAARVNVTEDSMNVHFASSPTSSQRRAIGEYIRDTGLSATWDVTHDGQTVGGFAGPGLSWDLFNQIDEVFLGERSFPRTWMKHMGPGPHPSGSDQQAHAGDVLVFGRPEGSPNPVTPDEEWLVGVSGFQIPHPGECYSRANEFFMDRMFRTQVELDAKVVHGVLTDEIGRKIGHAWVVIEDRVVYDGTHSDFFDKDEYYSYTKAEEEVSYTKKEAFRKAARSGHHGPWHETAGITSR